jgi:acetaldehyde dehydrogenase
MTGSAKSRIAVAILGSGNIGTDLLIKIQRKSTNLKVGAFVGIDAGSEGLQRAQRMNIAVTSDGIEGLLRMPEFRDIEIVFDATSAGAHAKHDSILRAHGKRVIDLTPAAVGPYTVPVVNGDDHLDAPNLNMVTCGGQATIPIVAAVSRVTRVHYAEIVASIASKSAGPGTRANIDEFTETTSRAIESVGGATRGKAIIVLNPAEPPMIMRDTVFCLTGTADQDAIRQSIGAMVEQVREYVPGYRLQQSVQFEPVGADRSFHIPEMAALTEGARFQGLKISVFLSVEGAAHYLPAYAGNLDIMTSAALQTAEKIAAWLHASKAA